MSAGSVGPAGDGGAVVPAVVGVLEQGVEAGVDGEPALVADAPARLVAPALDLRVLDRRDEQGGVAGYGTARLEQQLEAGTAAFERPADGFGVVVDGKRRAEVVDRLADGPVAVGDGKTAAGVQPLELQAAGLELVDQVEALLEGRDVRLDAGDLRAHVQVQAAGVERFVGAGEARTPPARRPGRCRPCRRGRSPGRGG